MKLCAKCKEKEKRSSGCYCKSCHNEYQKAYYKKHPRSINKSSQKQKQKIRELIIRAKDVPCCDCGIKYPYYVMDFDHVRGKKKFNLSVAASKYRSLLTVLNEINKCDIVCANCHRERTFQKHWKIR